jgi:hypothetical protein
VAILRHPIAKARYERRDDGMVKVTATDGPIGVFDAHGGWIEGPLRIADAPMCFWIAQAGAARRPGNLSGND